MAETEAKGNFWEEAPLINLYGDKTWALLCLLRNIGRADWEKLMVDKVHVSNNRQAPSDRVDHRNPKYRLIRKSSTPEQIQRIRLMEKYRYLA